jgi:polysaccharide export outer membrane protein
VKPLSIWIALLLPLFAAVACTSSPPPQKPAPALWRPPAPPKATAAPVAAAYIIGPGDSLQVFVWRNPELSSTVPVRPDGKISTPLVEDMVAVGKTPTAACSRHREGAGPSTSSPRK